MKDRLRDDILADHGFRVIRVTNQDVMTNMDGVLEFISLRLGDSPHPNPSPKEEGLKKGQLHPSPSGEGPGMGANKIAQTFEREFE